MNRNHAIRNHPVGLVLVAALLIGVTPVDAHGPAGGAHDHAPTPMTGARAATPDAAPNVGQHGPPGERPLRSPDGNVFVPKSVQRQLNVRTTVVVASALARTVELTGRVVMDPNAGGRVEPTQAGRIEAGPQGLPGVGQRVRKGDLLAYVTPSVGAVERAGQAAQLAELNAARDLANKRLARLQELADTVPRKEIEQAASEAASLAARAASIGSGLAAREALRAPVTGVIASAAVVSGQVVAAGSLLFEIVDPTRLRIEALVYDPALASDIAAATVAVGNDRVALRHVGSARSLREQALPVMFEANGAALGGLAVGQPVRVFVQTSARMRGLRLPSSAVVRNAANQPTVWIKTAPETFEPRMVIVENLDGVNVAVTSGLADGERVVTTAPTLINQIR